MMASGHPSPSKHSTRPSAPSIPVGLSNWLNGESGPGRRIVLRIRSSDAITSTAAAARQRGDGSRPSGNSSSASPNSGAIGELGGFHSQAATSAPGPPWRAY